MDGSWYDVKIEIVYVSGVLAEDDLEALVASYESGLGDRARDVLVSVSSHDHSVVSVGASVRGASPLEALTVLDTALSDALVETGLFDRFDVSRRMLHAGPWRPPHWA